MASDFSNSGAGGLQPSFRVKDAADLSLSVDYKLNKKWALWVDLNNIANVRYQRWNKYESFGFNFLAGIKFNFISQ
jgi:outer membrane receptor protein involved in Fe transport